MHVTPYLFYNGNCEEALHFYERAVGAVIGVVSRFGDSPMPSPPGMADKVINAGFRIGDTELLASDNPNPSGKPTGFSLCITAATPAEAKKSFDAMAEGGTVTMPMSPTFFAAAFGMLTDRFGQPWMVIAHQPQGA